jgi:hypothetical protein
MNLDNLNNISNLDEEDLDEEDLDEVELDEDEEAIAAAKKAKEFKF